jgi:NAD(P)-dependent dehydrogenase (short-subunit alcohol dehydrogenase family)
MRGLTGKRIVVASGATGIGAATAQRLAGEGAQIIIGDINETELEATVSRIRAAGGTAHTGALLAFLLSDDAQWITGQVLAINGGAAFRD